MIAYASVLSGQHSPSKQEDCITPHTAEYKCEKSEEKECGVENHADLVVGFCKHDGIESRLRDTAQP